MTRTKLYATLAALALVAGAFAAPAIAAKGGHGGGHGKDKTRPANTKMKFKLDDHELAAGESATGQVTLLTREGKKWAPFAGASLEVTLGGTDCGAQTTDAEGHATATCVTTADGEYVMRVRYAGDDTHKKAQRAQGVLVGVGEDDNAEELPEEELEVPVPDPSPTI